MAVVVYVGLRASFVESQMPASSLNYYGILALAALSGLFSGSILMSLTQLIDVLLDFGTGTRKGTAGRDFLGMRTELHQLDRYRGFLVHEQTKIDDSNKVLLAVWLQSHRQEKQASTEIDIGEGEEVRRVTFLVNVYPEECDVEPSSGELVAGKGVGKTTALRFILTCPPGTPPKALVELSQRGRTVAVVPVGQEAGQDSHYRASGSPIGRKVDS
jgi:hypothetical protein